MANKNLTLALKIKADLNQAISELDQMGLSLDDTRKSADKLNKTNNTTAAGFNTIAASVKAATLTIAAGFGLNEIISSADAWTAYQNRLRLVTDTQLGLQIASKDVYEIARETSQQLDSTAAVYQRFAQNADRLNISQKETAELTETVSKAIAVSGGSAASSEAALVQFGQALASGVLRGEEFNSVSEQAPALLLAIADGLDVDIGKLREMAAEGELTADKLVEALQKSKDAVDTQFDGRVKIVAQGATELNEAFTRLVGTMSTTNGMSATLAGSLTAIADVIDSMADNTELLGAVIDTALVLTAGRALIAVTDLTAGKIKQILVTRADIAAQLAAAKAHAVSTARQLASARAAGAATAASAAHTAALQRLAAAQSAAAITARGVLGILGGPVGMIAMTALAATGLYAFRDSTDDVKSSLSDVSEPLDKVVEGLRQLTELERQQELTRLSEKIDQMKDRVVDAARELSALSVDQTLGGGNAISGESLTSGSIEAIQLLRKASADTAAGIAVDFDAIFAAIQTSEDIPEKTRKQLLNLMEVLVKQGRDVGDLEQRYNELTHALSETEVAADNAGDALTKNTPAAEKAAAAYLESLQKQFRQLSDLSPVEQARSYLLRNQIKEHSDLGQQILEQAAANQQLDESNKAAAESQRKATAAGKEAQRQIVARQRDQQKYVEQLERSVEVYGLSTEQTREYELAEKGLSGALLERARAANAALATQEKLNQAMEDAQELERIQIRLLENSGKSAEARALELEQEFGDLLKRLRADGNTDGANLIESLIDVELARARLDEVQAEIDTVFDKQNREEQSIQTELDAGLIDELDARERLLKLHSETAAVLEQQKPILEALANQPGAVGEAAQAAYQQLNDQIKQLHSTSTLLESTLKEGLQGGIQTAVQGLADGTMTLRDAIGSLVQSVANAMTELLAKMIAQKAVLSMFGDSAGSSSGFLGGLFGYADGGWTGPGSKYQVAGVVHAGEFVQPSDVMQQPGALPFMESFRRYGMQALNSFQGYAEGGVVGSEQMLQPAPMAANGGATELNIFNSLDAGDMAQQIMGTTQGSRSIVNTIRSEKSQIKAILEG
ncbi:tape measure protein [Neptuniibacter marinus]|uniref:tape measure protein n=1 Tax=Neptuniibacter marinus TaxID=1806670 RepID=UPI003B58D700